MAYILFFFLNPEFFEFPATLAVIIEFPLLFLYRGDRNLFYQSQGSPIGRISLANVAMRINRSLFRKIPPISHLVSQCHYDHYFPRNVVLSFMIMKIVGT
jgi:hypothetical protein